MQPVSTLLEEKNARSDCCELPSKTREEEDHDEEEEKATASPAAATEISRDAAVAAVLSDPDGNFASEEEQRTALKAFFSSPEGFT